MLEYLCRLCGIVGGPMTLRLGDAEIADEVFEAMMLQLRQVHLRDFKRVIEVDVGYSSADPLGFVSDYGNVEAPDIVAYPSVTPTESVESGQRLVDGGLVPHVPIGDAGYLRDLGRYRNLRVDELTE